MNGDKNKRKETCIEIKACADDLAKYALTLYGLSSIYERGQIRQILSAIETIERVLSKPHFK